MWLIEIDLAQTVGSRHHHVLEDLRTDETAPCSSQTACQAHASRALVGRLVDAADTQLCSAQKFAIVLWTQPVAEAVYSQVSQGKVSSLLYNVLLRPIARSKHNARLPRSINFPLGGN
jgi:hypothetical protein